MYFGRSSNNRTKTLYNNKIYSNNTAKQAPKGFLAILKTKPETLTLEDYKKNMNEGQSKEIIAKDVNTPPEILAMLAKDGDKDVRAMCSIKSKYTTRNISNVSKRW